MPSPFPGMDPYLEHPQIFPGLHGSIIFCLKAALQPRLPEPYYADSDERVWVEVTQRHIEPDVNVLRARRGPEREETETGGVAVLTEPRTQPILVTVPCAERRETWLEIYTRQDGTERLVTAVEVLSPTNKTPGRRRDEYLQKQEELLEHGEVNLIEIDLLRAGKHTTAVPRELALEKAGPYDYHVCVHRFDRFADYFVYPIQLERSLPEIEVPLLPQDGSISVDLQEVFNRCYDEGPYHRRVRYEEDTPVPPLSPKQAKWAQELLAAKMSRPLSSTHGNVV